jgi:two-component system chemotaxis response regulator CheY
MGAKELAMAVETNTQILIVDDQAALIRILRNLLHQLGFENVEDAMDGTQALAKIREKQPGLVIAELRMDPMSGFDLLRSIKADDALRNIPIILIADADETDAVIAARKAGANGFAVKPFTAAALKAKINAACR